MKTLLIFPTSFEAKKAFSLFGGKCSNPKLGAVESFSVGKEQFFAHVCGYASKALKSRVLGVLDEVKPDRILLMGFGGACEQSLKRGNAVFSTTDVNLENLLLSLNAKKGYIFSSEHISDVVGKSVANFLDDALAVDMEGETIASLARQHNLPFANIRIISDEFLETLPLNFLNAIMDSETGEDRLFTFSTLKTLISNLSELPLLIRFGLNANRAKKLYEKFVEDLVFALSK